MKTRLSEIIAYKTGGKQTAFATFMGWSPQYLNKLVKGVDFGLAPIVALASKLPEINTRWLLLGEGEMLTDQKVSEVRATAQYRISTILEMEKYLPVMTPTEVGAFEKMCIGEGTPTFSPDVVAVWQKRLIEKEKEFNAIFNEALCKQKKAKK